MLHMYLTNKIVLFSFLGIIAAGTIYAMVQRTDIGHTASAQSDPQLVEVRREHAEQATTEGKIMDSQVRIEGKVDRIADAVSRQETTGDSRWDYQQTLLATILAALATLGGGGVLQNMKKKNGHPKE